jgi:hypothetical protein
MMEKNILSENSLSVWKANIETLRSLQPKLAETLEKWVDENGHSFKFEKTLSSEGIWVSGLASRPFYQPNEAEALPWRKNDRISVLFIHGVGTPPWLFQQLRAVPKDLLALIVIEPNIELLAYTLHMTHVYHAIPQICRMSFLISSKESDVEEALRVNLSQMGTYAAADAKLSKHFGETEVFREDFDKLWAAIRERIVLKLSELGNSAEDTLLGLRQIALVSPWFAFGSSLNIISEEFKGRPFVWVASGPSLDKNFQLLKEINNRAVIICADSALKKLLGDGIIPHIVVALERGLNVHRMFEENRIKYPDYVKDILLVVQAVCVTDVVAKWPGPKVVVGKLEIPVDQWLIGHIVRGDLLLSGLSVAHMALQLSNAFGASKVALIGQDLAYGEDMSSHASTTVAENVRDIEKSRAGENALMIPAALGGEVRTTSIWLSFLRIIERYMVNFSFKMYDCTEGGALINGTEVKPFREWIDEHLSDIEPFDETPAEIVKGKKLSKEQVKISVDHIIARGRRGFEFINISRKRLDDIEKSMERVTTAAIAPEVRQRLAYEMSDKFDRLHASNPVIEFVGQSITTLNAARVARTRFLDSVELVNEWKNTHSEIVQAHRTTLSFMESWLKYMITALSVYANENNDISIDTLPYFRVDDVSDISEFGADIKVEKAIELLDVLKDVQEGEEKIKAHAMLDNLIARADAKWWRFWDPKIDWKVGIALEMEGRIAEAIPFMRRMESMEMGIFGMAQDESVAFLSDMARILASRDLCHFSNYDEARLYAQNAMELSRGDIKTEKAVSKTIEFINEQASEHLEIVEAAILGAGNRENDRSWLSFEHTRLKAEKALADGDVMTGLAEIWNLVRESHDRFPQKALPFWDWLQTHILRFDEAGYDMSEDTFRIILDEMLPLLPSLSKSGMSVSSGFMELLKAKRGIKFEMEKEQISS